MNETLTKTELVPRQHSGRVLDRETGEPISGATVSVKRQRSSGDELIRASSHMTNDDGEYEFKITAADLENRIYLVVDVEHEDYAADLGGGYSYCMLTTNEQLGQPPFFSCYRLDRAAKVSGLVVVDQGQPVSETQVIGFWTFDDEEPCERSSLCETQTDSEGKFELNLCQSGRGYIWIKSDEFAVSQIVLDEVVTQDLGEIQLVRGVEVEVVVVDAEGKPLPSISINCEDVSARQECGQFVGTCVRKASKTNDHGRATLTGVLPGEQSISLQGNGDETCPNFFGQVVTVEDPTSSQSFEFRAQPHAVLSGRSVDSKGIPRRGHLPTFWIETNDGHSMFVEARNSTSNGEFFALIPDSTTKVEISLTTDQHTSFLMQFCDVVTNESSVLEMKGVTGRESFGDLTITWFKTTLLLVKLVDEAGNEARASCMGYYPNRIGHVHFNYQQSNKVHRSNCIVPGQDLNLHIDVVDDDGVERLIEKHVKLEEGETRQITIVI